MHQPRPNGGTEPSEDPVRHAESLQTPEEILAYWTPERMAQAEPREIRLPDPDEEAEDGSDNS